MTQSGTPTPAPSSKRKGLIIAGLVVVLIFFCLCCIGGFFAVLTIPGGGDRSTPTRTRTAATATTSSTPRNTPTATCADMFEEPRDDNRDRSKLIGVNETQVRNFDRPNDVDYIKMTVEVSKTYTIQTKDLGKLVDTRLTLERAVGGTLIDNDDDLFTPSRAPASRVTFTASATESLFVKVTNKWGTGGCGDEYVYKLELVYGIPATPTARPPTLTATPTPKPVSTWTVKWVDNTWKTIVLKDQKQVEIWELGTLQSNAVKNGVLAGNESLKLVPFPATGFTGLRIMKSGAMTSTWLRVGSLESAPGLICRVENLETSGKCWQVTDGSWVRK